jgi:hypothetical protein
MLKKCVPEKVDDDVIGILDSDEEIPETPSDSETQIPETQQYCYDTGPALPGPTLRTDLDTKVHAAQARVLASAVHDHSLSLY